MTTEEVAVELKMKSPGALRMARKRGHLRLDPIKLVGRRGQFYRTASVAELLMRCLEPGIEEKAM